MSKTTYTKEQIKEICRNKNVLQCSARSITFTEQFKLNAIRQYHNGMSPKEIFKQAGLDKHFINRKQPKWSMERWRKIYKNKGKEGFKEMRGKHKSGGRKKIPKDLTPEDKIKRLKAEIRYLKSENDFLARRRAQRKGRN